MASRTMKRCRGQRWDEPSGKWIRCDQPTGHWIVPALPPARTSMVVTLRLLRMEAWLALAAWAMARALVVAEKNEDYDTVRKIAESLRAHIEEWAP